MPDATAQALYDVELGRLRGQLADLNGQHKHVLQMLKERDDRLAGLLGLKDKIEGHAPTEFRVQGKGRRGEATAFMLASDWHLEERVDPRTIGGLNEFSPDIARARVERFFRRGLSVIEMCRHSSRIDVLVLALLGDHITGMIHPELMEMNYLSPTEASLMMYRLIAGGIDFLLENGGFKQILIPCCVGNHGRDTEKMRCSTSTRHSYEWMVYQLLSMRYANEKRVRFSVAEGYFVWMQVYGLNIRFHHGDNVKYAGGVGGVTIPLKKAIAAWNASRVADIDALGHWHQELWGLEFCLNMTLMGFNAFSQKIKARFEPPSQNFFLLNAKHPEYRMTVKTPIFLN